jgi:hypothetical protein
MRLTNLFLGGYLITASFMAFIDGFSFSKLLAQSYTILFAGLLIAYEMKIPRYEDKLQKNFGFMYHFKVVSAHNLIIISAQFP